MLVVIIIIIIIIIIIVIVISIYFMQGIYTYIPRQIIVHISPFIGALSCIIIIIIIIIIITIIIIIIIVIYFMQGIYTYIPETNYRTYQPFHRGSDPYYYYYYYSTRMAGCIIIFVLRQEVECSVTIYRMCTCSGMCRGGVIN